MAGCVCWWKQCHSRTLSGDQDDREDTGHEDDEVAGGLPDGGVQPADTFHACESTKSPGSRGSVVSIGSVCGAAGPGAAFTPQTIEPLASQELEAGKYTPTMKLDFENTPVATPAASVLGATTPPSTIGGRPAPSISPMRSFDVGEAPTPERSPAGTPADPLPDSLTGMVDKLQFSANKAVLREAWQQGAAPSPDAKRRQDQLQAAFKEAGLEQEAAAALGATPAAFDSKAAAAASRSGGAGGSWFARHGSFMGLLAVLLCLVPVVLVAVQVLPGSTLPPGVVCVPETAAACRAALQAQLDAAGREPGKAQLFLLRMKWAAQDLASVLWYRRMPEGVSYESIQASWQKVLDAKQVQRLSHEDTIWVFGHVSEELLLPEIRTKLAAAYAHKAEVDAKQAEAERIAREKAEAARLAAEKAEAERRAAEEARLAAERAEAERIAREKAEAERIAREKAEAERLAKQRAEAERIAKEKAEAERIAREKAEAERIAKEKAEAERLAKQKAEAERIAREKAEAEKRAAEEARIAREKAEAERLAKEKAEAEKRAAAAKAEAERRAAEEARQAAERAERERAEAERAAAAQAEAERLAAARAAEEARLAAEAAEAQRLAAERAAQEQQEAEERAAFERSEREAAKAAAGAVAGASWLPYVALSALLLAAAAGGGYAWHSGLLVLPGRAGAAAPSPLDDIRTDVDEAEGLAYQDLGDMDPDVRMAAAVDLDGEQEGASLAAGAAAAVSAVGAAAAGALAAGVVEAAAFTGRVLTPRAKAPRPPAGPRRSTRAHPVTDDGDTGDEGDHGAGSSRAAAAAATPRSRRGSRAAAAADAGADSDAGAPSTGKARGGRGRKAAAAAAPGLALEPLLEDAPVDAAAAEVEEAEPAAGRRGTRRQSAPAATRRRNSAAAAAAAEPEAAEAATPARRSTRGAARTPRV